jgi:hypothetical protein
VAAGRLKVANEGDSVAAMHVARRVALLSAALACLLAAAPVTLAWNSTGHQVIAQIAWREMTPPVREKVLAILKQHPQYEKQLAPEGVAADDPEFAMRVFARAATWPDVVRSARGKEKEYHKPEWHYINKPVLAEGTDPATIEPPPLGEKLEEGKPPQNILQALEWNLTTLKRADAPAAEKALAISWLEHLVGDLHQPLHTCAFFSPDYLKGDRGGNSFMVKHHASVTNLHAFWDDLLGGYMASKLVDAVTAKVLETHPRASLEKELAGSTTFIAWHAEGFALARDVVYQGGKLKGVTREASVADKGATTPELPPGYDETAREAARRRVALAGYRLAGLLNKALE